MSVLQRIENSFASLVEGSFSRVFRSQVRPVEIARKLAKEMELGKRSSVSKNYAPNEYVVYLSPRDRDQFASYERSLRSELEGYLLEHARSERLALISRPRVRFETDQRLRVGEFGIQALHAAAETQAVDDLASADAATGASDAAQSAYLMVDGERHLIPPKGAVIGRSSSCELQIDDAGISRRHAEVKPTGGRWVIADLGSTNGVLVNGRAIVKPQQLRAGDHIGLGPREIVFDVG